MKKLLMSGLIVLVASFVQASQDRDGSMRPALWRSTMVCHALNFVQLSTRAVNIHSVRIASASVNDQLSTYNLFNSTARPIPTNSANFVSTGTRVLTYVTAGTNGHVLHSPPYEIDTYYSSGTTVNKIGNACL